MKAAFGKISIGYPDYYGRPDGANGRPMAGYSRPHYADGQLGELCARAVLIEDAVLGNIKKRVLLISLDLLMVPLKLSNYIKEKIKEDTRFGFGIGQGQIMVHGIHTHSAPDVTGMFEWPGGVSKTIKGIMFGKNRNDRYQVWMVRQVYKMVDTMITELQPAKLAWTKKSIQEDIAINRRHPTRRSKRELFIMSVKNTETNKIFGIMASYGMHPTTMGPENTKMSAEYPGRVCYRIEKKSDNEIQAAFFTAAAGDINPITTCGTDFETLENDRAARKSVYDQTGTYEHTKRIGYMLGDYALEIANGIDDTDYYDKMELKAYVKTIRIPFKDKQPFIYNIGNWLSNKLVIIVKKWLLFPIAMMHPKLGEPNFPGLAVKHYPFSLKRGYEINVYTVIQYMNFAFSKTPNSKDVKKLALLGVPGELFEDLEVKIKKSSPVGEENTHIIQAANDWCAYIYPISEYITQAGYEPLASTTPTAGPAIVNEFKLLFEEIEHDTQLGYW